MRLERKHIRWRNWDYSSGGAYFVTICTKEKVCFFGTIKKNLDEMRHVDPLHDVDLPYPSLNTYLNPTSIAKIVFKYWEEIPSHYPFVVLDAFVVMPNHIHGVLFFDKEPNKEWNPNRFGPQKDNLADVIRAFKSSVKRWANMHRVPFAWQTRYHDRVIRDLPELQRIQTYLWNNPTSWQTDQENPDYDT